MPSSSAASRFLRLQAHPPERWYSLLSPLTPDVRISVLQTLSPENWFFILDVLLVRDQELDRLVPERQAHDRDPEAGPIAVADRHEHRLFGKLIKLFGKYQCEAYSRLLYHELSLPFDPAPEVETAGVRAVIEWLLPAPAFPPYSTPEEQQQLRELRRCLNRALTERLRQLEQDEAGAPSVPWQGEDWNHLERLPKRLLLYMRGRDRANLDDVFPAVWEREYEAGKSDVSTVLSKANNFLSKQQWPHTLHKKRGERVIYWD
jgi:hypothetical protein